MKKILSLITSSVIACSLLLSGCGSNNSSSTETSTAKATDSTAAAASTAAENSQLEPYELSWYYVGPGPQKDIGLVEAELNKYLKDKINVTVKMNCIDFSNYANKISTMIASSEEFDLCFTSYWTNYNVNASKGGFMEIDELLPKYAPKTKALFTDEFLGGAKVGGKLYAVPVNKDKAHNHGFIYRKDLADKWGLDMSTVKTWEDIIPILKTVKEKDPTIIPFSYNLGPINEAEVINITGNTTLGNLYNNKPEDNKIYNYLDTPESMRDTKFMHTLYTSGYMRKDVLTYKDVNIDRDNGKTFCNIEQLKPGKADELNAGVKVAGVKFAQIDITPPVYGYTDIAGSMHAISKTSQNPERAMMFLEYANTDKFVNNLINFGIENTHYKKIGENSIEPIKDSGYSGWVGSQWILANQYLNYILPGEDPLKWENFDKFNNSATKLRGLGFNFDPTKVKTQIAAVENVNNKYKEALYRGVMDPEKLIPKWNAEIKKAGNDEIMAELQAQFDAWLAAGNK